MQIPVLMPHKIVMALAKNNPLDKLLQDTAMDRETKAHLDSVRIKLQADTALALGIWIDGVPFNNNRSESIEVFSLDFPGIDNLRVPMAAVPKKFMLSNNATHDFILQCITESLETCAVGYCKDVGSIPKAVLCEVRGDWACFKSVFRLPGWQSKSGCCWKCAMTPAEVHQVGSRAFWRQPECRLDHWEILQRMLNQGNTICPLLMAPFVSVSIFRIDWLHCADLGGSSRILGQFVSPGPAQNERAGPGGAVPTTVSENCRVLRENRSHIEAGQLDALNDLEEQVEVCQAESQSW